MVKDLSTESGATYKIVEDLSSESGATYEIV